MLFLLEFSSNRLQTLAQWSLGIKVLRYSQLIFQNYFGCFGSLCGSMSVQWCRCRAKPHSLDSWSVHRGLLFFGDSIPTPFEHPYILKYMYLVMFQCLASVADSGPVLNQYCVFGMTVEMLHLTINISVATPFKHKTSTQCCFNVGLVSQIQH